MCLIVDEHSSVQMLLIECLSETCFNDQCYGTSEGLLVFLLVCQHHHM